MPVRLLREETVDPAEVFRRSGRLDLVFKAALAEAWRGGDSAATRRAAEAYLEMTRARWDFSECVAGDSDAKRTPLGYLRAFRRLCAGLLREGFRADAAPIPVDAGYELLNGAHRLAACFAYGVKCRVAVYGEYHYEAGGESDWKGFSARPRVRAVENYAVRAYFRMNPDARLVVVRAPRLFRRRFLEGLAASWRRRGATVWHWRFVPGGRLAMVVSAPGGGGVARATEAEVDALYPDLPFPDWAVRARRMWPRRLLWTAMAVRYAVAAALRGGRRREKALRHAREFRLRALGPQRLARAAASLERWGALAGVEGAALTGGPCGGYNT